VARRNNTRRTRAMAEELPPELTESATPADVVETGSSATPADVVETGSSAPVPPSGEPAVALAFRAALVDALVQSGLPGPRLAQSIQRAITWRFNVFARKAVTTEPFDPATAPNDGITATMVTEEVRFIRRGPGPVFQNGSDRLAVAVLLGKPVAEVTPQDLSRVRARLVAVASILAYLNDFAHDLQAAGCRVEDLPSHLRHCEETLSRLQRLASDDNARAPELLRLVLTYALNARPTLLGNVWRFSWTSPVPTPTTNQPFLAAYRRDAEWLIIIDGATDREPSSDLPRERVIRNPFAIWLLDCFGFDSIYMPRLRHVIEQIRGDDPQTSGALPGETAPKLFFRIADKPDGQVHVDLWIGSEEVKLETWKHVHNLLKAICLQPTKQFKGPGLKAKHDVSNPSSAAMAIKKSLENTKAGAGAWLLTNPIRWADGHAPKSRPKKRGEPKK
jgi:hypothetical protein